MLAAGLTAVAKNSLPNAAASPVRTLPTASTTGLFAAAFAAVGRNRAEVVLCRDRVVGVAPDLVDGAAEAVGDPGGEHRDERHERETDHQRGCGGRGALRIAARVVARERACGAADLRRRPAEEAGERLHDANGEHRDAEEDQQRADPHPDQDPRRAQAAAEEPVEERGEPGAGEQDRPDRAVAREARRAATSPPRARRRSAAPASRGSRDGGWRSARRARRPGSRRRSCASRT